MKTDGSFREKLIYVIGTLAFAVATVSLVMSAIDFLDVYRSAGGKLSTVGTELYDMLIDAVFAFLELTLGFSLIKQWRGGKKIDIHKTLSQIIGTAVYASFAKVIFDVVMTCVSGAGLSSVRVSLIYVVIYIFYGFFVMSMPALIKKHKLMNICYTTVITAAIAVGFCGYDALSLYASGGGALEVGTSCANAIVMCLISVFGILCVVYYYRNPDELDHDIKLGEDSEVIRVTEKYEVVRIYLARGTHDGVNTLIRILTVASAVFGISGIVLYAAENGFAKYLTGGLSGFIAAFSNIGASAGLIITLLLGFIYLLIYIGVGTAAFTNNAQAKFGVITVSSVGMFFAIFTGAFLILDVIGDLSMNRELNLQDYSIFELGLLALYVVYTLTKRAHNNLIKEISDGIEKRGDTYKEHAKTIARVVLFSGLYSIAAFLLLFGMSLAEGELRLSFVALLISSALIIFSTRLEVRHPFDETTKVRRKIRAK